MVTVTSVTLLYDQKEEKKIKLLVYKREFLYFSQITNTSFCCIQLIWLNEKKNPTLTSKFSGSKRMPLEKMFNHTMEKNKGERKDWFWGSQTAAS